MAPGDIRPADPEPEPSPPPRPKAIRQRIPPMPPEVAKAIVGVQKAIRRVGKDGHNSDGGDYRFASVDAFFEFLGPLLGEHGLIIDVDEVEEGFAYYVLTKTYRNGGSSEQHWMRARYVFTVAHESGATWGHNPVRTVDVLNTGPQAYGSAQSYATKMYLRSLFKVPTGDREDADYHQTDRDDGYGPGQSGTGQWRNDNRREPSPGTYDEAAQDIRATPPAAPRRPHLIAVPPDPKTGKPWWESFVKTVASEVRRFPTAEYGAEFAVLHRESIDRLAAMQFIVMKNKDGDDVSGEQAAAHLRAMIASRIAELTPAQAAE